MSNLLVLMIFKYIYCQKCTSNTLGYFKSYPLDIYSSSIHTVDFHVSIQYLSLLLKSGILGAFYTADEC